MDIKNILIAITVILLLVIIAWYYMNYTKKRTATANYCGGLNIQKDLSGKRVLCPPASAGKWGTDQGNFGIHGAASCTEGDGDFKNCNRCVGDTKLTTSNTYAEIPGIGLKKGWPNMRWRSHWPTYEGPVTTGQQMGYKGGSYVTDPAPVPKACL